MSSPVWSLRVRCLRLSREKLIGKQPKGSTTATANTMLRLSNVAWMMPFSMSAVACNDRLWECVMSDRGNEFMKEHGAKREFWDENLKFKYYKKTFREYWGSVYGLTHQPFPDAALTCEPKYQQWCVGISGYMPVDRGKNFKTFIRERLAEA